MSRLHHAALAVVGALVWCGPSAATEAVADADAGVAAGAHTDAAYQAAVDAHRRAQKHRRVADYEAALAAYDALLARPSVDARRRHEVLFNSAELAWELGRWREAYERYGGVIAVDSHFARGAAFNRILAAERLSRDSVVATEHRAEGERLVQSHGEDGAAWLSSPAPVLATGAEPLPREIELLRVAVVDLHALRRTLSGEERVWSYADGAFANIILARKLAKHGHLSDALAYLIHARALQRDLCAAHGWQRGIGEREIDALEDAVLVALSRRAAEGTLAFGPGLDHQD